MISNAMLVKRMLAAISIFTPTASVRARRCISITCAASTHAHCVRAWRCISITCAACMHGGALVLTRAACVHGGALVSRAQRVCMAVH